MGMGIGASEGLGSWMEFGGSGMILLVLDRGLRFLRWMISTRPKRTRNELLGTSFPHFWLTAR